MGVVRHTTKNDRSLRPSPWCINISVGDRPLLPAFAATIPAALESLRIDDITDASVKAWSAIAARFGNSKSDFDPALSAYARSIKLERVNFDRLMLRATTLAATAVLVDLATEGKPLSFKSSVQPTVKRIATPGDFVDACLYFFSSQSNGKDGGN